MISTQSRHFSRRVVMRFELYFPGMSARKYVSSRNNQGFRKRSKENKYKPKNRVYSRRTDCWNCGSRNHQKEFCPRPSSLKCSFCQRKNTRSDQCVCRRKQRPMRHNNNAEQEVVQIKREIAVFVKVYGKTVRASLNPSVQETIVSRAVASWVKSQSGNVFRKLILRRSGKLQMVSAIQMNMYTRRHLNVSTESIIDDTIHEQIIILGMQAIHDFGFQMFIGGQEVKKRTTHCIPKMERRVKATAKLPRAKICDNNRHRGQFSNQPEQRRRRETTRDDDELSFLDEEEAREIREWK